MMRMLKHFGKQWYFNNQQTSTPTLQHSGSTSDTSSSKAVVLGNYFFDCCNSSVFLLANTDCTFSYTDLNSSSCPHKFLLTEELVYDLLTNLDTSKSTGCNGISAKMLKFKADSITPSLTTVQHVHFYWSVSLGMESGKNCTRYQRM